MFLVCKHFFYLCPRRYSRKFLVILFLPCKTEISVRNESFLKVALPNFSFFIFCLLLFLNFTLYLITILGPTLNNKWRTLFCGIPLRNYNKKDFIHQDKVFIYK